jgi:uncharacterized protein (DUF433 family)
VLYVLNNRVIISDESTGHKRQAGGKQQVLDNIPLRVVVASMRSAVAELNRRGEGEIGKVVQAKFISQNQPVLAGTRIPVAAIKSFARAGYSAARIIKEFPELTSADVRAALAYESIGAAA